MIIYYLSLTTKFYQLSMLPLFIAVTKPIMQILPAFLAVLFATVAFASLENEKSQDLNLYQATKWKWPSLRSLFQVDTRSKYEEHHDESQQSSFRSRISRRRHSRYHP